MPQENPFVYKITKVNNTTPKGIIECTLKQDMFNDHADYVNLETGEMYCDYTQLPSEPTDEDKPLGIVRLSCNNAQLKLGAKGYRTITNTVIVDDKDVTEESRSYEWHFYIDDVQCDELIDGQETDNANVIKIKLSNLATEKCLNKILEIRCSTSDGYHGKLDMNIVSL